MASRPQFSLRTLLLVMLMVCLAAATFHRAPPKDWYGGEQEWKELGLAVHVQAWLRLATCVVFPAALVAAAVAYGGSSRAFCLGALLPAAMPLVLVAYALGDRDVLIAGAFGYVSVISHVLSERIAALWLCAPCVGFVCLVARWWLPTPEQCGAHARRKLIVRVSVLLVTAACAGWAIVGLAPSAVEFTLLGHTRADGTGAYGIVTAARMTQPSVWRELPLRMLLCLILPAVLGVAAVESRGMLRAFCAGGLPPALVTATLVSGIDVATAVLQGRWEPALTFQWRYSIFAMWALVPCFGLTAAFFYWLFQRGGPKQGTDHA